MKAESFSDIRKLKKFITSRPALKEIFKRSPSVRRKMIRHGNMSLHKRTEITGNGTYMVKLYVSYILYLF